MIFDLFESLIPCAIDTKDRIEVKLPGPLEKYINLNFLELKFSKSFLIKAIKISDLFLLSVFFWRNKISFSLSNRAKETESLEQKRDSDIIKLFSYLFKND